MFSSKGKAKPEEPGGKPPPRKDVSKSAAKQAVPSLLSASLRINGDVISDSPIQLDGIVEGDIRAPQLTVGAKAEIAGRVEADVVRVSGSVTGQIIAREVLLSQTAKVFGDVFHDRLAVEAGAVVEGTFKRREPTAPVLAPGNADATAQPGKPEALPPLPDDGITMPSPLSAVGRK